MDVVAVFVGRSLMTPCGFEKRAGQAAVKDRKQLTTLGVQLGTFFKAALTQVTLCRPEDIVMSDYHSLPQQGLNLAFGHSCSNKLVSLVGHPAAMTFNDNSLHQQVLLKLLCHQCFQVL